MPASLLSMKIGAKASMIQPTGLRGCLRATMKPTTAKGSIKMSWLTRPCFAISDNGNPITNKTSVSTPTAVAAPGDAHRNRGTAGSNAASDWVVTACPPVLSRGAGLLTTKLTADRSENATKSRQRVEVLLRQPLRRPIQPGPDD